MMLYMDEDGIANGTFMPERLVAARKRLGNMSQNAFAKLAKVSTTYIQKLEAGQVESPRMKYLRKIAEAAGEPPEYFLTHPEVRQGTAETRGTYRTGDVDKLRKWEWFAERWKAGDPETFVEMAANLPESEQAIIARLVKLMELEQHLG